MSLKLRRQRLISTVVAQRNASWRKSIVVAARKPSTGSICSSWNLGSFTSTSLRLLRSRMSSSTCSWKRLSKWKRSLYKKLSKKSNQIETCPSLRWIDLHLFRAFSINLITLGLNLSDRHLPLPTLMIKITQCIGETKDQAVSMPLLVMLECPQDQLIWSHIINRCKLWLSRLKRKKIAILLCLGRTPIKRLTSKKVTDQLLTWDYIDNDYSTIKSLHLIFKPYFSL